MTPGKLQGEIKKKHPFASAEKEALLNLMRTNDRIEICFTRLFRQHGITSSQYNVLRILRGEGAPLPILEIANRTITVVPGITGLIERLMKMELVSRTRSDVDRRVVFVGITEKGLELLNRLDEPLESLERNLLSDLNHEEMTELTRLLEKTRASIERFI